MHRGILRCCTVNLLLWGLLGGSARAHTVLLGVATHVINYPSAQPALLDLARKIGVDSVRADTGWKFVEATPGVLKIPPAWDQFVDRARRRGIEPLLILDYGNPFYDHGHLPRSPGAIAGFVRFATFVVRHFAGRVRYYEVWNEWNTGTGGYYPGGSAEDYARLFDATYTAIKQVSSDSVVLAAAGYGNWYEDIARLGVAGRADGVAIHPYVSKEPGDRGLGGANGPERSVQKVIESEAIMRRATGGREIPLYITEIGWPTSTDAKGYSEADVGEMAGRALLMFASLPYVRGVWWYDLIDDGNNPDHADERYGLFRRNNSPKPAAEVVQALASQIIDGDLAWDPESDLANGVVVIDRGTGTPAAKIAWQIPANLADTGNVAQAYGVSCAPRLPISPIATQATDLALVLRPLPQIFTFQMNHCSRGPLFGRD